MQAKYKLYLDRVLNSWGDRSWEFAIGLYLIKLHSSSFALTAIQGIFASLTVILFSPILGRWIERAHRLHEIKVCLFVQNISVAICCIFIMLYFQRDNFSSFAVAHVIEAITPTILVVFSAVAQLYSSGYTLCLEKDWIISLARDENELSDLNAMLRRLDLFCKTIAPSMLGFLMEYSDVYSAFFIMCWNIFSGLIEYYILKSIYNEGIPAILEPKTIITGDIQFFDLDAINKYRKHFLLPGLSFSCLYLTVLGFDSVTTGYISGKGISEGTIGIISFFAAIAGIIGTVVFQVLSKKLSLKNIGLIGYAIDLVPLSLCLFEAFKFKTNVMVFGIDLNMFLFLLGMVCCRIGLWTIDLSVNTLIQAKTPYPPLIGGVQNSVNISAELLKFSIVTLLPEFSQFRILILMSFSSVSLGAIIFLIYVSKNDVEYKRFVDDTIYGTFEPKTSERSEEQAQKPFLASESC